MKNDFEAMMAPRGAFITIGVFMIMGFLSVITRDERPASAFKPQIVINGKMYDCLATYRGSMDSFEMECNLKKK